MTRQEIKAWAREKIKKEFWPLLATIIVASILTNLSYYRINYSDDRIFCYGYSFGWVLYFIEVGLTYYLVKYINDENHEFNDIFKFGSDFLRCLASVLLQAIFIILWSLLLIIPGIIKGLSYSLVPYLLADSKYKDMGVLDLLKKSEEMMNGHKADLFVFGLSFILWDLLIIITLGIASFYVIPYQRVATTKFLNDIKTSYEKENNISKKSKSSIKYCPQCGNKVNNKDKYCSECGLNL